MRRNDSTCHQPCKAENERKYESHGKGVVGSISRECLVDPATLVLEKLKGSQVGKYQYICMFRTRALSTTSIAALVLTGPKPATWSASPPKKRHPLSTRSFCEMSSTSWRYQVGFHLLTLPCKLSNFGNRNEDRGHSLSAHGQCDHHRFSG